MQSRRRDGDDDDECGLATDTYCPQWVEVAALSLGTTAAKSGDARVIGLSLGVVAHCRPLAGLGSCVPHTGGLTLYEQNRAPLAKVTDDSTTTLMIRTLNQELTCAVCLGVIHNTRTVMECLHRFCANCISKSLRLGYESRSRAVPRVRSRVWESARWSRRVR